MENIKNIVGNFCKKIYDKINNVKFAEVCAGSVLNI